MQSDGANCRTPPSPPWGARHLRVSGAKLLGEGGDRFIVGTGRCGSTLLSTMLSKNPAVLDVSEFFVGLDWSRRLQDEPMSGEEFFGLLATPHPFVGPALRAGFHLPEVTYPFERPGARFRLGDDLPWVLTCTLPRISDQPDQLFDEIRSFCKHVNHAPPAEIASRLFSWLTKNLGKKVWVERSGAAISYLGDLLRGFPEARIVHVHRQGEASALSMREHAVFRIGAMLTYDIPIGETGSTEELAELSDDGDRVSKLLASRPAPHYFGRWWTSQLLTGFGSLDQLSPSRYAEVSFEDILEDSELELAHVATSLDLPDPSGDWRATAAAVVGDAPADRFSELAQSEQDELRWACLPGNRLLGRDPRD